MSRPATTGPKGIVRRYIPRTIVHGIRRVLYLPRDIWDAITGRRDDLTPPKGLWRFVGAGDFREVGKNFLGYFTELGDLKEDDRVLDVGCGAGRMAVPLARYLSERGSYDGFDVVPEGIGWCRGRITPRYPNFRFQLADLYNKQYNPRGRYSPSEYRFPYVEDSFDFVFLGSVFTHMLPEDMQNYMSEIGRVLAPGGRCMITYFLLNEESLRLMNEGAGDLDFQYQIAQGCRTIDEEIPERAVAYDEHLIERVYQENGLRIVKPIRYGSWCGRGEFLTYQDVVVAVR
jgi:SAM-dependent methyltransferase